MGPQKKTIAIADKSMALADLIEGITKGMGFEVCKMIVGRNTQPQDVASFVQEVSPNLVLLAENYLNYQAASIALGNLTLSKIKKGEGIDALAAIRGGGYTGPVYMISANPQHEKEAMKQGANGYLPITANITKFEEFLTSAVNQS